MLLPVYNGERYLQSALDSVLVQTFRDFELIAVDDGSTDGSLAVLLRCRDSRLRVLCNARNQGVIASLNRGLVEARGEYVARVDADDPSHPERFAKQVDFLDRNPDVVLIGARHRAVDDRGRVIDVEPDARPTAHDEIFPTLLAKNVFVHSAVMFRRAAVVAAGGYDPRAQHAEDYDLWLRLSERHRVANLPEILVDWRVHDEQVSQKTIRAQRRTADRLRQQAFGRRRAAGVLPAHARSPLPSLGDRLRGGWRTLGGDYAVWIDLYRRMGREDLARRLAWPGFAASPFSPFMRDELMRRYFTPSQRDSLRRIWHRARSLFRGA